MAGELGVADRLERGHLFVAGLHELRVVGGALPRRQQAVDAISGITEHLPYSPVAQTA